MTQLQRLIRELEEQMTQNTQALAEGRAKWERLAYEWARLYFPEDDWQDFREEDYTITSQQMLAELERWEQQ